MEQRRHFAAVKDAQTILSKEECAGDTVQNSNSAAVKDARIKQKKEECVSNTEQRSNYAAVKDAQIEPNVEESVGGMVLTVLTMDQLLSGRRSVH